jgi:hypothetical protein
MKKQILITAIFLASILSAHSQSSVQVLDLMPVTLLTTDTTTGHLDTTNLKEQIRFKVDFMAQADSACIYIGSRSGASDVMLVHCQFTQSGGQYFLNFGGLQFSAGPYEAYVEIPVTATQLRSSKYVQLFVWDKNRLRTNYLTSKYN